MYFLDEEERRYLLRGLMPRGRESEVASELRGWNWHQPPLLPIYDVRLGVYEVAGYYCGSSRDLYLRRVMGKQARPNPAMLAGGVLHSVVANLVLQVKRAIYTCGVECVPEIEALSGPDSTLLTTQEQSIAAEQLVELETSARTLWRFEQRRILARLEEALARQPRIGPDALAALAVPVMVEQKLDGTFLGLSKHLSTDAFLFAEPMVMDLKFGLKEDFHRLATTGYALVLESLHEYPVNIGCTVYVKIDGERVLLERDFHLIDDELRQRFVESRDEKGRMVEEEIDPGLAPECRANCAYWETCHAK